LIEKKEEYAETIRKYNEKTIILRNKKEVASFLETLTQNK